MDNYPPGFPSFYFDDPIDPALIEDEFDADDDSGDYDPEDEEDKKNLPNVDKEELEAIKRDD